MSSETAALILGALASIVSVAVAATAQLSSRRTAPSYRRKKRRKLTATGRRETDLRVKIAWIDSTFALLRTIVRAGTAVGIAFIAYTALATISDRAAAKAAIELFASTSIQSSLAYVVA